MGLPKLFAAQLRRPSGLIGSVLMSRILDRASRRIVRATVARLQPAPGDRVLDIGFGPGDSLLLLAGLVSEGRVVGVDFSPEMAVGAACRVRRLGYASRVHVAIGDAMKMPLRAGAFDAALTVNTIYFWPDLEATFREIARVVRPGGRIAIGMRPKKDLADAPFVKHGFTLYEPEEVCSALRAAGFGAFSAEHLNREKRLSHIVMVATRE